MRDQHTIIGAIIIAATFFAAAILMIILNGSLADEGRMPFSGTVILLAVIVGAVGMAVAICGKCLGGGRTPKSRRHHSCGRKRPTARF